MLVQQNQTRGEFYRKTRPMGLVLTRGRFSMGLNVLLPLVGISNAVVGRISMRTLLKTVMGK
jgi:hypothetical protein